MLSERQQRWLESVDSAREVMATLVEAKKAGRIDQATVFEAQKYWAASHKRKPRINPHLWDIAVEIFGPPVPVEPKLSTELSTPPVVEAPKQPAANSFEAFRERAIQAEMQWKREQEVAKKKKRSR